MQRYTVVFKIDEFANSSEEAGERAYQKLREMFDEYGNFDIEVVDSDDNVQKHIITTGPNLVHNGA
jgi:hypothetical protein